MGAWENRAAAFCGYLLVLLACAGAILTEFKHIDQASRSLARERGYALFHLIELARDWNAQHGGVYVPVTELTQPNPYLEHPRRDIRIPDGGQLTMINPAFMTRQIAEIAERTDGIRFHITSLKPIRPLNKADLWETEALQQFAAAGLGERLDLVNEAGQSFYRYMAPLFVKPACLQCHEQQGYQLGDVRGGISVTMPADAQLAIVAEQKARTLWVYGTAALLIGLLLHFVIFRTAHYMKGLRQLAADQERLVDERTASLQQSNLLLKEEISRREQVEQRLRISAAAIHSVSEGVLVTDGENRIIEVNPAFSAITGYQAEEVIGRDPRLLASGRHEPAYYKAMWSALEASGHWEGEIWNRRKDGSVYPQWLSISAFPKRDAGAVQGKYVATFIDITQRKASEDLLRHRAQTDPLTGLPNRSLFMDRVEMALNFARRYEVMFAVVYLDLDYFKAVNDRFGHASGDELLVEVAERMSGSVRDSDTVARLGGDEFAIVLPKLASIAEGEEIVVRVIEALARPFRLARGSVEISGSAGVAFYPVHGADVDALISAADQALYAVKREGKNGYRLATGIAI